MAVNGFMKKVILISFIVCAFISAIYAVDSKSVDLTLEIGESNIPVWSKSEITSLSSWPESDLPAQSFGETLAMTLYPSVKTNTKNRIVMTVSGTVMSADGIDTKIDVTATGTGADVDNEEATWTATEATWTATEATGTVVWTEAEGNNKAERIISEKLEVTLDQEDYNAALASDAYKATLTLNVTTTD